MDFDRVRGLVAGVPHMTARRGQQIYQFIRSSRPRSVLELGFAHGVSACYIGAALKENGRGSLTTIDLESAQQRCPNIDELLDRADLHQWVRPVHAHTSYTWELMRLIERTPPGHWVFDFVFIDGAHSWAIDGFAFFLVDRLLRPGGWILFDDLDWTYATSPTLRDTEPVRLMPREERETAQIGKVFDLLVRRHPGYGNFTVDGSWGWAQKVLP